MKDKILITGTDGFIGRNLYQELKSKYEIFRFEKDSLEGDWKSILKSIFDEGIIGVFHVLHRSQVQKKGHFSQFHSKKCNYLQPFLWQQSL